jgi:hypothetical protein
LADYESMTDLEIKQAKTRLHHLRAEATPVQDREIAAEMQRAQAVINRRNRERTQEYERIAATTPGAVSTSIAGSAASAKGA